MKNRWSKAAVVVLILGLVGSILPACGPRVAPESYLAVIPRVLHSGSKEAISLALFRGDQLATGDVEVALLRGGKEILRETKRIKGKGTIVLAVPDIEEGEYQVQVKGEGF